MLDDKGMLWLARNENGNLTDGNETLTGMVKLICPFCSGDVFMRSGSGFIHQYSPCSKAPSAPEASQIQVIVEEMLMAGENLYVKPVTSNGLMLAPDKINTRKGKNFQRDSNVNGLAVDLTWISSKGFRMGVIFRSHLLCDGQASMADKCYVAVIDTAALAEKFRAQPQASGESLLTWARHYLSAAGSHAIWRLVAQPNHRTYSDLPPVEAYQYENGQQWQPPEYGDRQSPTVSKKAMAILQQRVVDPVTQEIVCLCTVKVNEHEHDFQIAQYADQQILMSNVGEALPQSYPDYELILNACLKAERRYRFKVQKYT